MVNKYIEEVKRFYKDNEENIKNLIFFIREKLNKMLKFLNNLKKESNKIFKGANMITEVLQIKDNNHRFKQSGEIDRIRCFDLEDDDKLIISFKNENPLKIKYKDLKRALNNETADLYKTHKSLNTFMEICEGDIDFVKDLKEVDIFKDIEFPELLDFEDITDNLFNEFENIKKVTLESEGLYIGNGIRYIKLDFNDSVKKLRNKKASIKLVINRKDNDFIEELHFPIVLRRKNRRLKESETDESFFVLDLDTDKFLSFFNKNEEEALFSGYISISFDIGNEIYEFEIDFEIKMINPLFYLENMPAGVDFGTSSTCVAINKGRELVAFTDNPKDIKDYENATSIIIFSWKKIYEQWINRNVTIPHFNRSDSSKHAEEVLENKNYYKEHYNYSNYIKKELKEAPNSKTINAIISEIKLLPEKLEDDRNNKDKFIPFDKEFKKVVELTDNIEEENEETLNPIALYGYLIGRSLNTQIRHKIYFNYYLTMPVKFSSSQKQALISSLEYGIKRALPIWVREKVKVVEKYPESVALLGSAKKMKYFQLKDIEEEAIPFGVFDFGGGTLDFAFGIYRKSVRDERAILENEARYRDIVELFKIDGMEYVGGERIIERLAYVIYEHNKENMKDLEIPIIVPQGEEELNPYPQNLLSKSHIAKLNLKNISEKITRRYFIESAVDNSISVELFSIHSDEETLEIELQIPEEKLYEKLYEILEKAVENFKYILIDTFKSYKKRLMEFGYEDFDVNQVKIFQAGNASKNRVLQEIFKNKFKEHPNIIFLESDDENQMKKITPKNAVARGVLFLEGSGYYYYQANESGKKGLDRYIWFFEDIEEEGSDAKPKLKKGDTANKDFEIISRISDNVFEVCYTDMAYVENEDDENLQFVTFVLDGIDIGDYYFVYAKPYYDKYLEIRFGDEGEIDDNSYVIDLDKGEFVKEEG